MLFVSRSGDRPHTLSSAHNLPQITLSRASSASNHPRNHRGGFTNLHNLPQLQLNRPNSPDL
ncbi:MAG: hypothetical protein EAZ79_05475 [Oscillatoriales cyanobacterium]|nr:MAG: hypothetical protein EAZ79_05475 [Oscillatoriales cyanobacterium]